MKPPNVKFDRVVHHPPIIEKIFPSIPDDPDAEKVLPEDVDPNYKPKNFGGTGSSWESDDSGFSPWGYHERHYRPKFMEIDTNPGFTMDPAVAMKKSEEEYGWSP